MSKNNEESIIEVKDLSKSFGDHEVLRKIDFEVKKGEVRPVPVSQPCSGA